MYPINIYSITFIMLYIARVAKLQGSGASCLRDRDRDRQTNRQRGKAGSSKEASH